MTKVVFLPGADIDYAEAFIWYASESLEAADAFESAVKTAVRRIAAAPEAWPMAKRGHRMYILDRRFPYSLIYKVRGKVAFVTAVAHASRDPNYWRSR
ncbi:MAG: type II toxin-antitoxin system RelE/ParE family toxin [Planctomycetales bacterium]|nr:type II toxin-antitoxin system RelE/ParE family toxin [Planctomycetales bacterium]MBN8627588.1 type II toxin-antitoxin system RelE/ParE family toxin [Planctomycetota bacterium]